MLKNCESDTIPQKNSHKLPQLTIIYGCNDGYTVRGAANSGARLAAALRVFAGLGCVKNKGLAVYALGNGGVLLMCADHDAVKRAEIAAAGVVRALRYGTCDRMIGLLLFHFRIPSLFLFRESSDSRPSILPPGCDYSCSWIFLTETFFDGIIFIKFCECEGRGKVKRTLPILSPSGGRFYDCT